MFISFPVSPDLGPQIKELILTGEKTVAPKGLFYCEKKWQQLKLYFFMLLFFSQLSVRPPQTTILLVCIFFFFLGDGLDHCLHMT